MIGKDEFGFCGTDADEGDEYFERLGDMIETRPLGRMPMHTVEPHALTCSPAPYIMMPSTITRKAFECVSCGFVYIDKPTSQCDCMGNPHNMYYEGTYSRLVDAEPKIENT